MRVVDEAILDAAAIRALNAWCSRRGLSWSAAHPAGGSAAMLLCPQDGRRPWQRILVVVDRSELRLENEAGETLACGSSLRALLDAVDGGVGEPALPGPAPPDELAGRVSPERYVL